jgi:hypothetical protein
MGTDVRKNILTDGTVETILHRKMIHGGEQRTNPVTFDWNKVKSFTINIQEKLVIIM